MSKKMGKAVALILVCSFILNVFPAVGLAATIVGSIASQRLAICVIANERTRNVLYEGNYYLIVKMSKASTYNIGTTDNYYQA